MEALQNHPYVKAINNALKPTFLALSLVSLLVIGYRYLHIAFYAAYIPLILELIPILLCALITHHLIQKIVYTIASIFMMLLSSSFILCFIIPILLYIINKVVQPIMDHHFLTSLPKFVEDSAKEVLLWIIVIGLTYCLQYNPDLSFVQPILASPFFFAIFVFLNCFLFYEGIHPAFLNTIIGPIEIFCLKENLIAFYQYEELPYFFTHGMMSGIANLSGTGITIGIVLLAYHHFPKGTLKSACFGVNEPVIFGLPIVKNKSCFIPFVIGGTLNGIWPVFLMAKGLLKYPIFDAPYLGIGLEGFLVTLDFRIILINIIQILISILIWYPFYKKELTI